MQGFKSQNEYLEMARDFTACITEALLLSHAIYSCVSSA